MTLEEQLLCYTPRNEQEARDLPKMLAFLRSGQTPFERSNETAHFTASAWIVNKTGDKVLLIWHNLYQSWAWTGGHADGERDLRAVARREAMEESGLHHLINRGSGPLSLEILSVAGHEKHGTYISAHLHYNVTYLFEADERAALKINPDENSGAGWFTPEEMLNAISEPWMKEHIYPKLLIAMHQ